jgi:6-phosphofructokinase
LKEVSGILPRGGMILGTTSRGDPIHYQKVEPGKAAVRDISGKVIANPAKLGIDAIITIGGDGSQKIGYEFSQKGLKIVGVPKTSTTIYLRLRSPSASIPRCTQSVTPLIRSTPPPPRTIA